MRTTADGFSFSLDVPEARDILDDCGLSEKAVVVGVKRAINRTLEHSRKSISDAVREVYRAKAFDVKSTVRLIRATYRGKRFHGALRFAGEASLPLIRYGAKERKKGGVTVKVLKGSRGGLIKPGGSRRILATSYGKARAWIAKGNVMAMTEDADHPFILYGPSFLAFFKKLGVAERIMDDAGDFFDARLAHEISFLKTAKGKATIGARKRW